MIRFRIKELMEERGIKKPKIKLLIQKGMSHRVAQQYTNGERQTMTRKHMEIFCSFLRCTPNDLYEWIPDPNEPLDEAHPLHAIKPRQQFSVMDELNKLTPGEIRKLFGKDNKPDKG